MNAIDTNVLVYAHDPRESRSSTWLCRFSGTSQAPEEH